MSVGEEGSDRARTGGNRRPFGKRGGAIATTRASDFAERLRIGDVAIAIWAERNGVECSRLCAVRRYSAR